MEMSLTTRNVVRAPLTPPSLSPSVAHTVIPIQRQHAHKIETGADYTFIPNYRRKMRLASESVVEEETRLSRRRGRGVPHSLRRRREIVAALKLPRPESVDQLETEIKERGDSIQKARRKRIHDYPTRR